MALTISATGDDIYRRIHTKLVKEEEGLDALDDEDIEVYSLILIQARARQDTGALGSVSSLRLPRQKWGCSYPTPPCRRSSRRAT